MAKQYSLKGFAGLVSQHRRNLEKALVGLYQAEQAGFEADSENPWITVCEAHGSSVRHASLRLAKTSMHCPSDWCSNCRGDSDESQELGYMQGRGAS